jgi:hypothetical protein
VAVVSDASGRLWWCVVFGSTKDQRFMMSELHESLPAGITLRDDDEYDLRNEHTTTI